MIAYQLCIFAEDKPGQLANVTSVLAKADISIRATTISTAGKSGVINLIVDDPKRAKKALDNAGLTVHLKNVLAVLIPDRPGGLDKLPQALLKASTSTMPAALFWNARKKRCLWWTWTRLKKRKNLWKRTDSKHWIPRRCRRWSRFIT